MDLEKEFIPNYIILGDFNLNMFNDSNDALKNILPSYELIINEATQISGSLIHHVYINDYCKKMNLENGIVCDVLIYIFFPIPPTFDYIFQ